jgi:hypothetical protein
MGNLLRLAVLAVILIGGRETLAQTADQFTLGHGVVCDTQKQIERYLALVKENSPPGKAVQAINIETENPTACGISKIAFLSGSIIGNFEVSGGVMRVIQIVVIAKKTERGWVRVAAPTWQYTAVFVTFDEA